MNVRSGLDMENELWDLDYSTGHVFLVRFIKKRNICDSAVH